VSRARQLLLLTLLVAPFGVACDNGPLPPDTTPEITLPTSPVTEIFSSNLVVGGSASRSFVSKAGAATVTLTSLGTSSTTKIGMGLGIPDALGSGCLFTRSTETAAGGQLAATLEIGSYCVKVWDIGTLTAVTNFTVTIVRP